MEKIIQSEDASSSTSNSMKPEVEMKENTSTNGANEDLGPPLFDAAATKRLLRKMDLRLLPFLALLYL